MGLLDLASNNSIWRGYDYYEDGKVKQYNMTESGCYEGTVSGSDNAEYHVQINLAHPRTSTCDCPHAAGKRIICKHMVALYLAMFPDEAEKLYQGTMEAEQEEEERQEKMESAVIDYIKKMKKSELQDLAINLIFDVPEWRLNQFLHYTMDYWDY